MAKRNMRTPIHACAGDARSCRGGRLVRPSAKRRPCIMEPQASTLAALAGPDEGVRPYTREPRRLRTSRRLEKYVLYRTQIHFAALGSWLCSSGMTTLALTELLGATVYDPAGAAGRVREVTIAPQEDRSRVASLIVKTRSGNRVLPFSAIAAINGGIRANTAAGEWAAINGTEGLFLLERDLLDQQVIDVNGRKVVRVNDVDLEFDSQKDKGARPSLRVHSVDVGARGAIRRLLRGVAPRAALQALLGKIPPRSIPWDFVDVIETDPARRVKLKISHEGLAKLHPADIADIVEELAPDERQAVFQTLDEETAAEALEEVEPRVQKAIVESLDSEKAADIVEEMDPDAAADLLADLSEDRTEQILVQMEPEAQHDVVELLEHREETAAGRMTTDFLALPVHATVQNAIDSLREDRKSVV